MKSLTLLAIFAIVGSLILKAQPINDTCTGATFLATVQTVHTVSVDLTNATESIDASCEDAALTNLDLWYSFTMPFDGKVIFKSVHFTSTVSLFSACTGTELYCGKGDGFLAGLVQGQTYYLRYAALATGLLTDNFTLQAFPIAPNDDCGTATVIPSIVSQQSIPLDNREALESMDASCESAPDENLDLWYQFTMPFTGKIKVWGLSVVHSITLFDMCNGTEVVCRKGTGFIENLSANTVYVLRYASAFNYASANTLYVQAFAPPANDDCSQAQLIPFIDTLQSVPLDNRGASESLNISCENSSTNNLDLWYSFDMPFDGKIKLSGLSVVYRLALFDSCGGNEVACQVGTGFISDLDSGQTYFLRLGSAELSANPATLFIQAFPPPINDSCHQAIFVPNLPAKQTIALDTRGATESLDASCETASKNNLDLWYSFQMPFQGKVQITGVFGVNRLSLYDQCGGTELACFINSGFFSGLDSGKTYLFRYAAIENQASAHDLFIEAFPAPVNDDCSQAIQLSGLSNPVNILLDPREATESVDVSCEQASKDNLDLWYRLTMPFDGKLEVSGVFGVNTIALFDSCGGTEISCFQGNGFFYQLKAGESLLLRYAAIPGQAVADQITIQAFPDALNDDCETAILLSNLAISQTVNLDTRLATESLDSSCEDSTKTHLDVWYTFEMPFSGKLEIQGFSPVAHLSLYDSCGGNEIGCFQGNGQFYALEDSQTYWLRYANLSSQSDARSFQLVAVPPPAYDSCHRAIVLDSIEFPQRVRADLREAFESVSASCEVDSLMHPDVWYRFTMPFFGRLEIGESDQAQHFALWDSCQGQEISCFKGMGAFVPLQAEETYWLRYASTRALAAYDSFMVQAIMMVGLDPGPLVQMQLFPNPASDQIQLQWAGLNGGFLQAQIIDPLGRILSQKEISIATGGYNWHLASWPPGLYHLHLRYGPYIRHISFVKT